MKNFIGRKTRLEEKPEGFEGHDCISSDNLGKRSEIFCLGTRQKHHDLPQGKKRQLAERRGPVAKGGAHVAR